MTDRNESAELMELLQVYVVASIAGLDAEEEQRQIERLRPLLGETSDWRCAVRERFALPEDFDQALAEAYETHKVSAEDGGLSLDPEDFARAFVMHNLVVGEPD